jgi:hypothetical protein
MNLPSRLAARLRQLGHHLRHPTGQVRLDGPLTPQLFNLIAEQCTPMPEARRIEALWMMLAHGRSTGKLAYVEAFWTDQTGLKGRVTSLQWQGEWWCNPTARWTRDYPVFLEALSFEVRERMTKAPPQKPLPAGMHFLEHSRRPTRQPPMPVFPLEWTLHTSHLDAMETAPGSRAWLAEFEAMAATLKEQSTLDQQVPQATASGRPRRL